uniref:Uncharacterized protein n=1 Tax=Clandestinovirus TaxID=2831644 RepID=A0A8F8KM35_9VIRU|nr:hypothetical protein KOM_12_389 [Clandestinovirus]
MDTIDLIRTKLGVLASLPKHTRLRTSNGEFDLDPTWVGQGVMRFFSGDSRSETCNQLDNLVDDIALRKDDIDFSEDVRRAIPGIDNLIDFYKSSAFIKSRLQNIRRKMVLLAEYRAKNRVCAHCLHNLSDMTSPERDNHLQLHHGKKSPLVNEEEEY